MGLILSGAGTRFDAKGKVFTFQTGELRFRFGLGEAEEEFVEIFLGSSKKNVRYRKDRKRPEGARQSWVTYAVRKFESQFTFILVKLKFYAFALSLGVCYFLHHFVTLISKKWEKKISYTSVQDSRHNLFSYEMIL